MTPDDPRPGLYSFLVAYNLHTPFLLGFAERCLGNPGVMWGLGWIGGPLLSLRTHTCPPHTSWIRVAFTKHPQALAAVLWGTQSLEDMECRDRPVTETPTLAWQCWTHAITASPMGL